MTLNAWGSQEMSFFDPKAQNKKTVLLKNPKMSDKRIKVNLPIVFFSKARGVKLWRNDAERTISDRERTMLNV